MRQLAMLKRLLYVAVPVLLVVIAVKRAIPHPHSRGPATLIPRNTFTNLTRRYTECDWETADDDLTPGQVADPCQQAFQTGRALYCMMSWAPGVPVTQNPWPTYAAVDNLGWQFEHEDIQDAIEEPEGFEGLDKAFDELDINPETGWHHLSMGHIHNTPRGSDFQTAQYPASFGEYHINVHADDRAIIAQSSWSPRTVNTQRVQRQGPQSYITPERLVPMGQWSDLTFHMLQRFTSNIVPAANMWDFEHFFFWQVVGENALKTLQMVFQRDDMPYEWPGMQLEDPSDPRFKALLSADNCKGLAWLLGQHKAPLGVKTVDRINVFNCPTYGGDDSDGDGMEVDDSDGSGKKRSLRLKPRAPDTPNWCMYLHVVDVDNGDGDTDMSDSGSG